MKMPSASTETDSILCVSSVHHRFRPEEPEVLHDINLELAQGEVMVLTGPSGSGKTTLLTLIGAVRSVSHGSIRVDGTELTGLSPHDMVLLRRRIGFIFQHHALFPALSALQNVELAFGVDPVDGPESRRRCREILTELGLGDRLHYRPHSLSGGQCQRVAVARALVRKPRLILADEPTAALDQDSSRLVVERLRALADRQGSAIIIVTHDNRILDVADRILNLIDGRIGSNVRVGEALSICRFLQACPAFSKLETKDLAEVSQSMRRQSAVTGEEIVRQGEAGDRFYLIRSGLVEVIRDGKPVARLGEGEFFGEAALLTGAPRNATVRALEPSTLFSLHKDEFDLALERSADLKSRLLDTFFQRLPA
jgi:putative ABC transport system ATP-binding protein